MYVYVYSPRESRASFGPNCRGEFWAKLPRRIPLLKSASASQALG